MNGDWFWWGKKAGDTGYKKLYRMLFERLSELHALNNLLWVYNANELNVNVAPYADFYPGDDVVDMLATDVYRMGFADKDYETLSALAGQKPVALGEVGRVPTPELLAKQPRWAWFMVWNDTSTLSSDELGPFKATYGCDRTLCHGDLPWNVRRTPRMHHPIIK
jgi:mannan endo-1,4-beta-mannosidase